MSTWAYCATICISKQYCFLASFKFLTTTFVSMHVFEKILFKSMCDLDLRTADLGTEHQASYVCSIYLTKILKSIHKCKTINELCIVYVYVWPWPLSYISGLEVTHLLNVIHTVIHLVISISIHKCQIYEQDRTNHFL